MPSATTRLRIAGGRAKRAALSHRRSRLFTGKPHPRFWWHQNPQHDYVPGLYRSLSRKEWRLMGDWYAETARRAAIGEINVPAMSLLEGFILGSGIRRT